MQLNFDREPIFLLLSKTCTSIQINIFYDLVWIYVTARWADKRNVMHMNPSCKVHRRFGKLSGYLLCIKLNLLIHNVSKIWMPLFWTMVCRWEKWSDTWKALPGSRSEIENVLIFSISALPLEVPFQMSVHFLHLWTVCQKRGVQILER